MLALIVDLMSGLVGERMIENRQCRYRAVFVFYFLLFLSFAIIHDWQTDVLTARRLAFASLFAGVSASLCLATCFLYRRTMYRPNGYAGKKLDLEA